MLAAALTPYNSMRSTIWAKWDANIYLQIATQGYDLSYCKGASQYANSWCGNTGWFPGFPFLVWVGTSLAQLSPNFVGAAIAVLGNFIFLYVLWTRFLQESPNRYLLLALAAVFPGSIYYQAVFPLSVTLTFILCYLSCLQRREFLKAGLFGSMACFTYATGFLLIPLLFMPLSISDVRNRPELYRRFGGLLMMILGLFAVFLVQYIDTGFWNGFFLMQGQYGHGLHVAFLTLFTKISPLFNRDFDLSTVVPLQTLIVFFWIVFVGALCWRELWQKTLSRLDLIILSFTFLYWLFPLTMGVNVSLFRADSLLLPSIVLLNRANRKLLYCWLIIFIPLSFALAHIYFKGFLV